jgi:hypothetical protein
MISRRISAREKRERGLPSRSGNSQARALTATTISGGKARRCAATGKLVEAGQARLEEALTPFADNLTRDVEAARDNVIAPAIGGIEYDLGPNHVTIR